MGTVVTRNPQARVRRLLEGCVNSLRSVPVEERFWTHRLRWRLRGASWLWPAFFIAVVVDALILHYLPPVGEPARPM